jgi:hypothetical protein
VSGARPLDVAALDGAEAAPLERMLSQLAAERRGQVLGGGPADVTAAVALARIDMVMLSADDDATGTARETLDPKLLHEQAIRHKLPAVESLGRVTPESPRSGLSQLRRCGVSKRKCRKATRR